MSAGHLVLLGLMGSGKSSVGAALASRTGRPLLDSDVEIERTTGRTVRELAAALGTDAMHDVEADQLLASLAWPEPAVIAPAASTIEQVDCRAALGASGATAVWLRVAVPVLVARFSSGGHRPDFGRPVAELLAEQMATRGPLFASVADLVVDPAGSDPRDVADEIVRRLTDNR